MPDSWFPYSKFSARSAGWLAWATLKTLLNSSHLLLWYTWLAGTLPLHRQPICSNWLFQRQMLFLVWGWMLKRRRNARCTAVADSVLINSRTQKIFCCTVAILPNWRCCTSVLGNLPMTFEDVGASLSNCMYSIHIPYRVQEIYCHTKLRPSFLIRLYYKESSVKANEALETDLWTDVCYYKKYAYKLHVNQYLHVKNRNIKGCECIGKWKYLICQK